MKSLRILSLFLVLLIFLSLAGCDQKPKTELQRFSKTSLDLFDTVTVITGFSQSQADFDEKADRLLAMLEEYHKLYDIYNSYDGLINLKTVNDRAVYAPVSVDQKILDLLEFGRTVYEVTGGMTNIAMGSVLGIWHEYREAGLADPESAALPTGEELIAAAAHTDIDSLVIDPEAGTVFFSDPQLQLDVGSIAKGYAAEQVSLAAEALGWDHLAFSVGGNVRVIGSKGDGTPWTAGVQNPDLSAENNYFCRLELTDYTSLVTSGSYQRYYTVDGKQYHHIISPITLQPENTFVSVSILCRDSGMADALSTALFNLSYTEGRALVEKLEDIEAAWVNPDGSWESTEGFSSALLED